MEKGGIKEGQSGKGGWKTKWGKVEKEWGVKQGQCGEGGREKKRGKV